MSENEQPAALPRTAPALDQAMRQALPYAPNAQQDAVVGALARFVAAPYTGIGADPLFLLNGYAGTGKTSLIGALVTALRAAAVPVMLMAPTGRAAKVLSAFAHAPAFTIHRKIYRYDPFGGNSRTPAENRLTDAIFIVDEASMIGDDGADGSSLLDDLIQYVYSSPGCRLILLGDTAQLPPVGAVVSPAMDVERLRGYGLKVSRATLTSIARQGRQSGILANATWLRRAMAQPELPKPKLLVDGLDDVAIVMSEDLPEELDAAYRREGFDETILITRSNSRAAQFNRAIRSEVLYYESELVKGEPILIAKNNYFWSQKNKNIDFIANGDIAFIDEVYGTEHRYGMRFADVRLFFPHTDVAFDAKVMLDTLAAETPALPADRLNKLYQDIWMDPDKFEPSTSADRRMAELKKDPYFNALQVKYAYAVTCHKAQGGQWANVFVDMGYIPPEAMGMDFYRWLYTATTRATKRLAFINPSTEIAE